MVAYAARVANLVWAPRTHDAECCLDCDGSASGSGALVRYDGIMEFIRASQSILSSIFVAALGITGGHCDNNLLPFEYHARETGVADGVAGVQQKVREVIKYGASVIKFCATGGVLSKGTQVGAQQYTAEEMAALIRFLEGATE